MPEVDKLVEGVRNSRMPGRTGFGNDGGGGGDGPASRGTPGDPVPNPLDRGVT